MRLPSITPLLTVAILLLGAVHSPARSQVLDLPPHPRLIVYGTATNPTRLEELRSLVDETGSPQQWSERKKALVLAFRALRAGSWMWYERNLETEWGESPVQQDDQYRCLATLALTDLLMKDKGSFYPEYAGDRIYAQKANAFLHWWRDHDFHNWGQNPDHYSTGNSLGYAELLAGYALFYDWCYDYLSVAERAYHARAIYHLITDEEHMYLHANGDWRNGWYDNNHLGVIFGAVGLATLALDQDDPVFNQTARDSIDWYRQKAASRVRVYFDASFPDEGAGIEGVLYAMYGMNLGLPYALATQRLRTVAQGYDPLPWSMRVDAPRNAYQTPTWLYCEQLPFNPCGGTPLNDTSRPPYDINASFRAWPWLMAFSSEQYPNLAVPFFYTIYPPAMIEDAVATDFDFQTPDPISDPFDIRQVTGPEPECAAGDLNSCGILLGWPEADPYPTLDPSELNRGMYFSGRGITYFRTGVQLLNPDGTLDWRPDSCLITFECRQHPTFPAGVEQWNGHTQEDVNHFTVFFAQQPLFYDSGYAGWGRAPSFFSSAHSLHEIRIGSVGSWQGFADYSTMGSAIGSVIGSGVGPSFAGGINTECWSSTDVARSVRRIVVLPRPGAAAPYFLLHDDFELTARGRVRANMQTGNEYEGGIANVPLIDGNMARWEKGDARAILAFLSPPEMELSTPVLAPNDTIDWPAHWVVRAEVPTDPTRHQIVSLVELRFASDGSPELVDACFAIPTSDPEGLAYQIDSGRLMDVVAFRPYDRTEDWWIYPQGYPPIEAEQATVVAARFDESAFESTSSAETIRAGLLSGGGELYCDGHLVAALSGNHASTLSFSEAGVSVWADGDPTPEYFVCPITPAGDLTRPSSPEPEEARRSDGFWVRRIPNPLQVGAQIEWPGRRGPITIGVYDVSGRLLRAIESGATRSDLSIRWDGRTSDGETVPTGLYLLRIQQGESAWGRRVVILR
jgi:hypothetical protein